MKRDKIIDVITDLDFNIPKKDLDNPEIRYASRGIVINEKGFLSSYHPHLHCLFALKKGLRIPGSHVNAFSYKRSEIKNDFRNKKPVIFFNDFEILLQKIWYLIFNNIDVNLDSINSLELGYSVYGSKVYKDYKEVFKYAMKGLYDDKTSTFQYSEQTFETLKDAIHRKKFIQGYGILNKKSFLDDTVEDELDDYYNQRIIALRQIEDPMLLKDSIFDIAKAIESNTNIRYISKNQLRTNIDIFAGIKDLDL